VLTTKLIDPCDNGPLSGVDLAAPLVADRGHIKPFVTSPCVTNDTLHFVPGEKVVLLVRSSAEPSRHRVAVWREVRRLGAPSLGDRAPGRRPDVPAFADGVARAIELAARVVVVEAAGQAGFSNPAPKGDDRVMTTTDVGTSHRGC
jgi:hypothetical protein